MTRPFVARQGDILILATTQATTNLPEVSRDSLGRLVLAEGEVTGHAHAIADPDCALYGRSELEDRFLQVLAEGGVSLTHDEHDTITIPPGSYVVRRQREWTTSGEIRFVAD